MHKSIATIDSPEFINLQPLELNPLMSQCEIKVLYVGENRNHSFITKEVATNMSKTLRGAPIVGYYKEEKEDFRDHGHEMTFDGDGISFNCKTVPYGFVAPNAKVWFQKFEDYDDFGNTVVREYLMTTGYLWTGQFKECQLAVDEGRPQSMELDEETLDGKWSTDTKRNMEFFIINDATFSKLCILGEDVEPCFEGSSVTAPNVSASFSLDDNFKHTLFTMMQDLKHLAEQGGLQMTDFENASVETPIVEEPTVEEKTDFTEENPSTEEPKADFKKEDEEKKDSKEDEKKDEEKDPAPAPADKSDDKKDEPKDKKDEDEKKKPATQHSAEFEALSAKYSQLENQYEALKAENTELKEFKNQAEDKEKDALIAKFYMLSDEDKKDVMENKRNYSLEQIEGKLSIICVRKRVNFDLEDSNKIDNKIEKTPSVTFNLEDSEADVPGFLSALHKVKNN